MITSHLQDGHGSGNTAKIGDEGELSVVAHPHPPKAETDAPLPYRSYFTDSAGSKDMRVATETVFSVRAAPERDIFIKSCLVTIADAGAALNQFGSIPALTNGVRFMWHTQDLGEVDIHEGLTSNFDFVALSGGLPAIGSGNTTFRANNVEGTSEGYIPFIDFERIFGVQWGLRLRAGTEDTLSFVVRDDTSGVDRFDAVAYGIRF